MSYKEGCHPIFPYTAQEKQEIRKELGLKESTIQEGMDSILEWFEKQPHLIDAGLPDRDFVERMLLNAKGSIEKAKRRIDNIYKFRYLTPELVQNRENHLDTDIYRFYQQATCPELYNLKRVTVIQITDSDPNSFDLEVLIKTSILLGDIRLKCDYFLGDIWVLDLTNATFGHLLRVNPLIFTKASRLFLDGIGIRLYAGHIIGAPSYAQQLMQFFRKFASPKLADRVVFHDNLEDLYKYVPKKYLPKDYGGDQPSFEYFKEKYLSVLRSEDTKKFVVEVAKQMSDESKRPDASIHDEYLSGSFKKLDLD
ncbi:uncharacterized protein LOC126376288 [Pectinophora gossypiella]|uniref:uncharacterized protein LOC126376288 n=1 Tax=Pectinophora gossypiella TaxID=13191 RepID=UPI00214E54DE|nr:uncharacterized protein LOC126376288 [Pectinophora gossypiella]